MILVRKCGISAYKHRKIGLRIEGGCLISRFQVLCDVGLCFIENFSPVHVPKPKRTDDLPQEPICTQSQ